MQFTNLVYLHLSADTHRSRYSSGQMHSRRAQTLCSKRSEKIHLSCEKMQKAKINEQKMYAKHLTFFSE